MIQTVNINLGGRLFVVNQDAYDMLLEYTDTLHNVFIQRANDPELVEDIESRLSELISESLQSSDKASVDLAMVRDAIQQVGRPEDFLEVEIEPTQDSCSGQDLEVEAQVIEENPISAPLLPPHKKFFRDPQDKMIGGVCSGAAAYFHTDPTWIRIAAVLLAFISLSTVAIIYLVLCCVIPEARTPLERMQMNGEAPTLSNIARSVTNAFKKGNSGRNSSETADSVPQGMTAGVPPYSPTERKRDGIGSVIVQFFAIIGWIILGALMLVAIPVGLACVLGIIGLLVVVLIYLIGGWIPEWVFWLQGTSVGGFLPEFETLPILTAFFSLTALLIPCIALVWAMVKLASHKQAFTWRQFLAIFILWFVVCCAASCCISLL